MNPFTLVTIGFALVLVGFLVPFLMVLRILDSGLALSFSAYFSSLAGLVLSLYGVSHYSSSRERGDR
jgi:hypothetical protein